MNYLYHYLCIIYIDIYLYYLFKLKIKKLIIYLFSLYLFCPIYKYTNIIKN